ncbi:MAG: hypothetical protein QXE79_08425, partial [Candidatus Bathyarchaeia archaeon]
MSYNSILKIVFNALKYLAQGSGEKEAIARSIKEARVQGRDISRSAFKIFMEISKHRIRYDQLIHAIGDSNISSSLRRIIYLFLYHAENYDCSE